MPLMNAATPAMALSATSTECLKNVQRQTVAHHVRPRATSAPTYTKMAKAPNRNFLF